ncbi:MAG TPA: hypothetical protein VG838_16515 [Opitutaceae bacterium]|nr:hypothetical protein [Opitutaceae bacterium]
MNAVASSPCMRGARIAAAAGVVALALAALVAWRWPASFAPAWRCAMFACVGPALGSLVFVLIHELTGGEWGRALRPFLLSGVRLLPWSWLLIAGALWTPAMEAGGGKLEAGGGGVVLRAVGYGVFFFFICGRAIRAWPRVGRVEGLAWVGPAGLISVLFLTHLLASDWLAGLDPHWLSTAFPAVWLTGQAVAGLAAAILGALLAGADPARVLGPSRRLGIDWGTLLFAAAMFWCYVAFAQFLIVWSGNLPRETGWYARRLGAGWRWLPLALVALHFAAPLVVLLSRRAKQDRRALALVAALLLGAQCLHTAWLIVPIFPEAPAATAVLALLLVVALGGIFTGRYLVLAGREEAVVP